MNHQVILTLFGKLFVVRGYQSGSSGDFLGDNKPITISTSVKCYSTVELNRLYKIKCESNRHNHTLHRYSREN